MIFFDQVIFSRQKVKQFALALSLIYISLLTLTAVVRSFQRRSIISPEVFSAADLGEAATSAASSKADSRLQLQDFHRVEFKQGRPVWEVKAKDAKYYPLDFVTHVNEASVIVYTDKNGRAAIQASEAKLSINGSSLSSALLQGKVRLEFGSDMKLETESAQFNAVERVFKTSGLVRIFGEGFDIIGKNLSFNIESGQAVLEEDVKSEFRSGAETPKNLLSGLKEK